MQYSTSFRKKGRLHARKMPVKMVMVVEARWFCCCVSVGPVITIVMVVEARWFCCCVSVGPVITIVMVVEARWFCFCVSVGPVITIVRAFIPDCYL